MANENDSNDYRGDILPEGAIDRRLDGSRIRTLIGWLVLAAVLVGSAAFIYRIWFFAAAIKSGRMADFEGLGFGSTSAGLTLSSAGSADRELVEAEGRPSFGPDRSALTVVVFADFQCPYCRSEAPVYRRLMNAYGDQVRFVFRHFPIDVMHPEAEQAALAAECAHEQGKFWPFHDKLLLGDGQLATDALIGYGQEVGLDRLQFEQCLADRRYLETVRADFRAGQESGVSGTPTFFFNGQRISGAIPEDVFRDIVSRLLQ